LPNSNSLAQCGSVFVLWLGAERVNDFAPLFVMNLLRKAVVMSG
jgi:hypothetical protein